MMAAQFMTWLRAATSWAGSLGLTAWISPVAVVLTLAGIGGAVYGQGYAAGRNSAEVKALRAEKAALAEQLVRAAAAQAADAATAEANAKAAAELQRQVESLHAQIQADPGRTRSCLTWGDSKRLRAVWRK
jgi:hypothetical protein